MTDPTNPYWGQAPGPGFGTGAGTDVNRLHDYDDVDIGGLSHHHTLGPLSGQSASGTHSHNGIDSSKIGLLSKAVSTSVLAVAGTGAELKDTGIGDVPWNPVNRGIYIFTYIARARVDTAAPISADVVLRYNSQPNTVTNLNLPIDTISLPLQIIGGGGAQFIVMQAMMIIPDDNTARPYNVAIFYKKTSGAATGTFVLDQSANSRRQLRIRLDGWK